MSKKITPLLQLSNINLSINKKRILEDISFDINAKDIKTIIGPNGAGKSSLLKLIIGQNRPTSGYINKKENLKIGYIPQKINIDPILPITVSEFLNNSTDLINFLELQEVKNSFLYNLSGGEMQRVLLARALIRKPELLLLDEFSQGLDISGILKFYKLLDEINQTSKTAIIMVSHDLNIVLNRTDEIICLNRHICCHGLPTKIKSDKEFLNLFGDNSFNPISIYQHNHDHCHNRNGDIIC